MAAVSPRVLPVGHEADDQVVGSVGDEAEDGDRGDGEYGDGGGVSVHCGASLGVWSWLGDVQTYCDAAGVLAVRCLRLVDFVDDAAVQLGGIDVLLEIAVGAEVEVAFQGDGGLGGGLVGLGPIDN